MLDLYWRIGKDIIAKQEEQGWGAKVITQLSKDLSGRFPDDKGYSERNLRNMKRFAKEYSSFPIWQVPLAELPCDENGFVQVSLSQISWKRHQMAGVVM